MNLSLPLPPHWWDAVIVGFRHEGNDLQITGLTGLFETLSKYTKTSNGIWIRKHVRTNILFKHDCVTGIPFPVYVHASTPPNR